ncbi:hypothetical protein AB0M28_39285 [Streptomyces sp. NPDC051940]|uniref:hypothetical protein n=1 Tax=Streptomyces sp. NPDC051940 TaxID=3155675 RepID=UPI003444E824
MKSHEFEPARLLIGLVLVTVAVLAGLEAAGEYDWPDWWPMAATGAGMLLGGVLATMTWGTRRARTRAAEASVSASEEPEPELGGMPMEELRGEYDRRFER